MITTGELINDTAQASIQELKALIRELGKLKCNCPESTNYHTDVLDYDECIKIRHEEDCILAHPKVGEIMNEQKRRV